MGSVLSLSENGKTMRFKNPSQRPVDAIAVDQCWLPQQCACDYLVLDWNGRPYLVELKGVNIDHALDQFEETVKALLGATIKEEIMCFLIATAVKTPQAKTLNRIKRMQKRKIHVFPRSREYRFDIPA
jgi:hypothetical protein